MEGEYEIPRPGFLSHVASLIIKYSFPLKLLGFSLYYIAGIIFYHKNEGWSILETTYFITVTITTCGYGFFHPTTETSKIFTIFFIFFGLIIILTVINGIANSVLFDAQEGLIRSCHGFYDRVFHGGDRQLSNSAMRFYKVQFSLIAIFALLLIGTLFFSSNEEWSAIDAAYWTVCTMTTVGYGDLTIQYESTRIFAIFFILSCVLIYTTAVGNLIEVYIEAVNAAASEVEKSKYDDYDEQKFSDEWINKVFPENSAETVSKHKVILLALIEMGVLDQRRDIRPLTKILDALDTKTTGQFTKEDIFEFTRLQRESIENDGQIVNPIHNSNA